MAKLQALIDQITERLCARIVRNGLSPGEVLGTERQLAAEFGVAYGTMRESISRLRALGVIKSKPRVGLIVDKAEPLELFGQLLPFAVLDDADVSELLEFRISIELGALEWTIERADEEVLKQIEATLDPFERLQKDQRIAEADPYDIKFHSLLLKASGNQLLSSLHTTISKYFSKAQSKYPNIEIKSDPARILDHRHLLEAIRRKDLGDSVEILRGHLRDFSLE